MPRLSIVIPTCNRAGLLERAVRSALAQSCRDIEVIVVDDASDHPAGLPMADGRLRILRLPCRSGHAAARNGGTREARAPIVAYLDDDDELERFSSRTHTELFFRLNPACSIIGLREPTYRLHEHAGDGLSRNPRLRQESFALLLRKHRALIEAHPRGFARLLTAHPRAS
jgi:glycosyltransferase involved in cell wall biosynthesis